jgi:Zn ribbon nucleic-acid-binding protein
MDTVRMPIVECLNCGATRAATRNSEHRVVTGDSCARCGYVGWAATDDLSEATRRLLRDRPLIRRRLLTVA